MGKADLHAHTCHDAWGDGNQSVEALFRHVEEETDLDLFAITDHDSTASTRAALEVHRQGGYRFGFIPGVEVTNLGGHLLCFFPSGEVHDIPSLRPFWWTVRYAQERGAVCIPAHPVFPPWLESTVWRGLERGMRIDALEAINAGIPQGAQGRLTGIAGRLGEHVALVANSDAHDRVAVGAAYTSFPGHTVDDFLRALQERTTEPVFVARPEIDPAAKSFTVRRSMTRPGWVRNLWREVASR